MSPDQVDVLNHGGPQLVPGGVVLLHHCHLLPEDLKLLALFSWYEQVAGCHWVAVGVAELFLKDLLEESSSKLSVICLDCSIDVVCVDMLEVSCRAWLGRHSHHGDHSFAGGHCELVVLDAWVRLYEVVQQYCAIDSSEPSAQD